MVFAITYATTIAFFGLNGIFQRILFRIRVVALLNVLQSAVVLAAFLNFISTNMRSWQAAMFSLYIGNVLLNVIFIVHLRQYIRLQFDRFWSWKILSYAVITLPASITAALMGVDRILINKFITTAAVGIYNAYYLPSISVSLALWGIVNIAFFPFASKSKDKLGIFRNVNKAVRYYHSDAILLSYCNIAKKPFILQRLMLVPGRCPRSFFGGFLMRAVAP